MVQTMPNLAYRVDSMAELYDAPPVTTACPTSFSALPQDRAATASTPSRAPGPQRRSGML
ncbi:hypothetical protein Ssi03_61770 [Sphaerisporangium siamense]|nr:hypothetical protein Ssi03_61770 [Sphaerisporangium siamense]